MTLLTHCRSNLAERRGGDVGRLGGSLAGIRTSIPGCLVGGDRALIADRRVVIAGRSLVLGGTVPVVLVVRGVIAPDAGWRARVDRRGWLLTT